MTLARPCRYCGERFQPATSGTKICDDCHKASSENRIRANKRDSMKENKKYPYKKSRK